MKMSARSLSLYGRLSGLLCCLAGALGSVGCDGKSTYVLARFERGPLLVGDVARLDLELQLAGGSDTATIENADGSALVLPLTRALQIVRGQGRLDVTAHARNQTGTELAVATAQTDVTKGGISGVTLVLGGTGAIDMAVGDAPAPDLGASDDLAMALDLTPGLSPPTIQVTPPSGAIYELGSDGKSAYVWTITASQPGAALPPVLIFDNATLATGMVPSSTSPSSATLTWRPSFRQAGSYSIKVIAKSSVAASNESSTTFPIDVLNTVDPIGNFYLKEDSDRFGPAKSLGVQGIGDFNGDGFDDVVHATRVRRIVSGDLGDVVETSVRFYVLLGDALGLPLPSSDSTATLALPHPRIRRIATTVTRAPLGTEDAESKEAVPSAYATVGRPLVGARLFREAPSDNGFEIFYSDYYYALKPKSEQYFAQVFAAASNASDNAAATAILDPRALMPSVGCTASDCEYPVLAPGELNGDGRDDLLVYTYQVSGGLKTRRVQYVLGSDGVPTVPTIEDLTLGGTFTVCKAVDANKFNLTLGAGRVLPGAGSDFGLFGCTEEYGANAYFVSDGINGFANVGRQVFFTPPKSTTDTTAGWGSGLCDLNNDGFDDLYRLNTAVVPNEVQVYFNQAPSLSNADMGAAGGYSGDAFPVLASGELDASKMKKVVLAANTPGFGGWQWDQCVRGAGKSMLFVTRGYAWENARYEVIQITMNGAGELVGQAPWTQGQMTWPGDNQIRDWFNRAMSGGDFNGDGKLDVITTASAPQQQFFWNVVYGR